MNVRSGTLSRTDVYVQMPFRHLQFEKHSDVFKASYSMTFIVRNGENEIIHSKEIDRPIIVRTYEETVSYRLDIHFQSFSLMPGAYSLEVIAVDNLSSLRYRSKEQFTAVDFSLSSSLASSILFLDEMEVNNNGISLRPVLPPSLSMLKDSMGMFQEIYHTEQNDTVSVTDTYLRRNRAATQDERFHYLLPPYFTTSDLCSIPLDSIYYRSDSTFIVRRSGSLPYITFHPLPGTGESNIVRTIIVRKGGTADTIQFSKTIFRREHRLRSTLSLNEIVTAMKFILRKEEFDSLFAAEDEQKIIRIHQFWEHRGGKERRIDFERKVVEANALFSTCVDGFRTAMGIVYVICGSPDYIDCRGSFVETWYYTIGDRAYSFPFRRENDAIQHFQLTPYSVNESVWQYFVDRWRRKS